MHVGKKSFNCYYTCQNFSSYCTHTLPVCVAERVQSPLINVICVIPVIEVTEISHNFYRHFKSMELGFATFTACRHCTATTCPCVDSVQFVRR